MTRELTVEEKQVCWAWARWTAESIKDALEDHDVERVDEDGFLDIVTDCMNDIAQSNAKRATEKEGNTP